MEFPFLYVALLDLSRTFLSVFAVGIMLSVGWRALRDYRRTLKCQDHEKPAAYMLAIGLSFPMAIEWLAHAIDRSGWAVINLSHALVGQKMAKSMAASLNIVPDLGVVVLVLIAAGLIAQVRVIYGSWASVFRTFEIYVSAVCACVVTGLLVLVAVWQAGIHV